MSKNTLSVSSHTETEQGLWGFWAQASVCLPLLHYRKRASSMTFPEFHQSRFRQLAIPRKEVHRPGRNKSKRNNSAAFLQGPGSPSKGMHSVTTASLSCFAETNIPTR